MSWTANHCYLFLVHNFLWAHLTELQTLLFSLFTIIATDADRWIHCSENRTFCGCSSKLFAWHIHLEKKTWFVSLLGYYCDMLVLKTALCRCKMKIIFKEVLMFPLFHSDFLMFLRHMAVLTGGPTAVHLGQCWRAPRIQQIPWITHRRLSQYPILAKKTSMTFDINNGLWSARGLMISNSLTVCGDRACRPGKYDEITTVFMLG